MEKNKKKLECSLTRLCRGLLMSRNALFLVPVTLFSLTLSCPHWFPLRYDLCQLQLGCLESFLQRKFMFLLCNLILIYLSRDNSHSLLMSRNSAPKNGVYEEYMDRKRNSKDDGNSSLVGKMGYLEMDAVEEEEEHGHAAEVVKRRFAEFIDRVREKIRRELLSSRGRLISRKTLFLVPTTLLSLILPCAYWFPLLRDLSQPLLASIPSFLQRKFMFLLCNLILVYLSWDNSPSLMLRNSAPKSGIYDEYLTSKSGISLTKIRNSKDDANNSLSVKMGYLETNAVEEEEEDTHKKEEEQEYAAEEMNRRFTEFINRVREKMRREERLSSRE